MGFGGERQKVSEAHGVILSGSWRSVAVMHDFRETRQVGEHWRDFSMCGLDFGQDPDWINPDLLNPDRVRACKKCWVPE